MELRIDLPHEQLSNQWQRADKETITSSEIFRVVFKRLSQFQYLVDHLIFAHTNWETRASTSFLRDSHSYIGGDICSAINRTREVKHSISL